MIPATAYRVAGWLEICAAAPAVAALAAAAAVHGKTLAAAGCLAISAALALSGWWDLRKARRLR